LSQMSGFNRRIQRSGAPGDPLRRGTPDLLLWRVAAATSIQQFGGIWWKRRLQRQHFLSGPYRCHGRAATISMNPSWQRPAAKAVAEGIEGVAFGDLFLEDVRAYRERQLEGTGLTPIFPVWGLPTQALAEEMIASGLRARLTCVDTEKLDSSFVGREFDSALLSAFPAEIDPCGERGEFHSFVYAGPMLTSPIPISLGETLIRERFAFADLTMNGGI